MSSFSLTLQIVLVGTKSDLKGDADQRDKPDHKDITKAEGDQLATEIKATCYKEVSSKTGDGMKELLQEVIRAAIGLGKSKKPFK